MNKKMIGVVLSTAMALTAMPANVFADDGEKMKISIACWDIQDQFQSDNAANDTIFNEMCEKLNVEIEPVQVTWNDWTEKNNVWAASGQLPDMFVGALATDNTAQYKNWARQGIIKAFPEDLSAYPNIERVMEMDSVQPLKVDGKFYMFPRMTYEDAESWVMDRVINYRKDWAAEAGWTEVPKTFDEFVEMCTAVKELHPEATILSVNTINYLLYLGTDIMPEFCLESSFVYENEKWIPNYASEKVPEILERFQKLYNSGILDADFVTSKDGDAVNKFLSGKSFAHVHGAFSTAQMQQLKEADDTITDINDAVGIIPSFTAEDGNNYYFSTYPYWSETFISNTVDDEKMEKCLEILDYMSSDEYTVLKNNGIEGVDWEKQDGKAVSLLEPGMLLEDKYPISQGGKFGCFASWNNDFAYNEAKTVNPDPEMAEYEAMKTAIYNNGKENQTAAPINFDVMLMDNEQLANNGNLKKYFIENLPNIIIGDGDVTEAYNKLIGELNNMGLQEMIDSVTAQAKEEGIQ